MKKANAMEKDSQIKLVPPNEKYAESYLSAIKEFQADLIKRQAEIDAYAKMPNHNPEKLQEMIAVKKATEEFEICNLDADQLRDSFKSNVVDLSLARQTKDRPKDAEGYQYAPEFNYWIVRDNEYLGQMMIRPRRLKEEEIANGAKPSEVWNNLFENQAPRGSVASYFVRPSARGVLQQALPEFMEKAQSLGIEELTFAVDKNNKASIHIIENKLGKYCGSRGGTSSSDKMMGVERYFVDVKPSALRDGLKQEALKKSQNKSLETNRPSPVMKKESFSR